MPLCEPWSQPCVLLDRDPVSKASLGARLETVLDKLPLSGRDGPKREDLVKVRAPEMLLMSKSRGLKML